MLTTAVVQTIQAGSRCRVLILHDPADPCSWIVRRQEKGWMRYRTVDSVWFNLRSQAELHARKSAKECAAPEGRVR